MTGPESDQVLTLELIAFLFSVLVVLLTSKQPQTCPHLQGFCQHLHNAPEKEIID